MHPKINCQQENGKTSLAETHALHGGQPLKIIGYLLNVNKTNITITDCKIEE